MRSSINLTLHKPIWADERVWCKYARRFDVMGASNCPMLKSEPNQKPWCALNGDETHSSCVFDEPDSATVWHEINESVAEYQSKGWG